MVGGKRSKGNRRELLGSHQKCWVWGEHVVREALRAGRWIPMEVWIGDAGNVEELVELAKRLDVPVERRSNEELTRRCGSLEHQGLMAKMPQFPYRTVDDVLDGASGRALFLVLDRVQDPHNFGAMIRSAEVFGVDGIVIGTQSQCGVTASVARSSAGAINHVPIVRIDDLAAVPGIFTQHSIRIVSAAGGAELTAADVDLKQSSALVLGNEGLGIDERLLSQSDDIVRIPQFGSVGSLNVAVAAGILLYEARRQRESSGRP